MDAGTDPRALRSWRVTAVVALASLIIVAGALGYVLFRTSVGGTTARIVYFGSVFSGQVVRTTDCAPYDPLLPRFGSCNATQVSIPIWVNSTNVLGLTDLLVSLNVTTGPVCVVVTGESQFDYCRYMLELSSPTNPPITGQQPPMVNLTVYLVNESQNWVLPASGYGADLTIRYIDFGPTTPFTADLKVQLSLG